MLEAYDNFIRLAIKKIKVGQKDFLRLKKEVAKETALKIPSNPDLREYYEKMVAQKKIPRVPELEKALRAKKIRTLSGVAVVAVLTKPYPCPGNCFYCPNEKNLPRSYLKNEPAVMRAITVRFDPYFQVQKRLRALELNGHPIDKIELIVMGGTFSYLPKKYQKKFITECFRACDDYDYATSSGGAINRAPTPTPALAQQQKINEKSQCRIVGLTLETRPDYINAKEILNFRDLGATRVELGIQSLYDDVLKINRRGHGLREIISATKMLRDSGFKISYHMMPGLPGSNFKKDFQMFQKLFSDENFQPDMLKIYPTVVVKNSALYAFWKKGKYPPMSDETFEKLALEIKNRIIPPYVRISRLVRDVPESSISAGPKTSNLRQLIAQKSHCQCIRCREVRTSYKIDEKIILDRIDYAASDGKEIFLQYVSSDKKKLFALLRLRLPQDKNANHFIGALKNAALVREVHTYGKMASLSQRDEKSPQHIGLGKKLIQEAERITQKEFGLRKIAVISGVGVRNYYRQLGYRQKDGYMVKVLHHSKKLIQKKENE